VFLSLAVLRTLRYINLNGKAASGIFRIEGDLNDVRELYQAVVLGSDIPQKTDVLTVAQIAKLLLRKLPETLLTNQLHRKFMELIDDGRKKEEEKKD